jgi:hypothetical protein
MIKTERLTAEVMWRFGAFWIALLFLALGLPAQTPTGTILGTISDTGGAVIPKAHVTVTNILTNVSTSVESNESGYFEVPFLLPGSYRVAVEQVGFKQFVRTGLMLDTDQHLEVSVAMQPGQVQQTVTVTGASPLVDTTTSSVGEVIENTGVIDLPLSNRNLLQLTGLVGGVEDHNADAAPATTGAIAFGHWSANGGMSSTNGFMLDGANAQNADNNAATIIPTIDLIDQFKIQTSSMPAEYGRTDGAVLNATTKSGDNSLHGTVYEFWKNRVLNANTWINNHSGIRTAFTNVNTFGYSLGGPVTVPKLLNGRNKLFFFTNYEGYRDVLPTSLFLTVPTALERTGNFSQLATSTGAPINIYDPTTTTLVSGTTYTRQQFTYNGVANVIPPNHIDPTAAAMMAYYPMPNTTPTNAFTQLNNYFTNPPAHDSQNEWSVRIDDNLSSTKRIFVRYTSSNQGGGASNYFPSTVTCSECNSPGNPAGSYSPRGGGSALYVVPKNAVAGYTQTITDKTILDIRASINRQLLSRIPQSAGLNYASDLKMTSPWEGLLTSAQFPPTTIANYQGLGTASNGDLYRLGDTTGDVEGSVTHFMGNHTIKAGGDYRIFRVDGLQATNNSPVLSFTQTWTQQNPFVTSATSGWSLASFLIGTPNSGTVTLPYSQSNQWFYYAAYVQDDWRLSSRITLNLGLRYELETPFTERHNASQIFSLTGTSTLTAADPNAVGGLVFMGINGQSRHEAPVNWTNFAPRVGVAFKISDSLVWRGAYGIFYAPFNSSYIFPSSSTDNGFQASTSMVTSNNGGLTPANYLSNPFPGGLTARTGNSLGLLTFAGQSLTTQLGTNVRVPYIQQYNTGLEYQFKSFFFGASYVGSHGVHQIVNGPLDQIPVADLALGSALNTQVANPFFGLITSGTLSTATISQGQLLKPFPQFADVQDQFAAIGNMHFNSMQLKAVHRLSRGFSYLANYTWSKNIGDVGDHYWNNRSVQNEYNPRGERAISPVDEPTILTIEGIWDLPFGRGRLIGNSMPHYLNQVASGWKVSGDYNFVSGAPLAIANSVNVVGFGAGSRPNWNGQNPTLSSAARTQSEWFNTADFSLPATYAFGNVPPYLSVLRGPHTNLWNTAFFKDTSIGEHMNFEIRGELYNLANHPIWAAPGTTFGAAAFGVVASKSGNRTGQLGGKIIF